MMTADNNRLAAFLKKMLFPQNITCLICGCEIQNGEICGACKNKLPFLHNACFKCGCRVHSGSICIRCKNSLPDFDKNYAVCDYDDFVKNIIYRLKNGDKYLYGPLADLMAKTIIDSGEKIDIVVSVPITEKVKKQRGYNQSGIIAEKLSRLLNIPYLDELVKTRETLFQKNCSATKRRENVEKAFSVRSRGAIKNKRVLIADDIITTGSTLSECALTLKKAGAEFVVCCTFAAVSPRIATDSFQA